MKKLMIALAAVAVGFSANATAVKWNVTGATTVDGTASAGSSYMAYFVNEADLARATMLETYVKDNAIDLSFLDTTSATTGFSAKFIDNKGVGTGATGPVTFLDTGDTKLISQTFYGYAIVINSTSIESATKAYVTAVGNKTTGGTGQNATIALTGPAASGATWYAVAPEPTSGLLMLLGMAGLALRRRRA